MNRIIPVPKELTIWVQRRWTNKEGTVVSRGVCCDGGECGVWETPPDTDWEGVADVREGSPEYVMFELNLDE